MVFKRSLLVIVSALAMLIASSANAACPSGFDQIGLPYTVDASVAATTREQCITDAVNKFADLLDAVVTHCDAQGGDVVEHLDDLWSEEPSYSPPVWICKLGTTAYCCEMGSITYP